MTRDEYCGKRKAIFRAKDEIVDAANQQFRDELHALDAAWAKQTRDGGSLKTQNRFKSQITNPELIGHA